LQILLNNPRGRSEAMTQSLTVAEKILFHLFQNLKSEDKYEVPSDIVYA